MEGSSVKLEGFDEFVAEARIISSARARSRVSYAAMLVSASTCCRASLVRETNERVSFKERAGEDATAEDELRERKENRFLKEEAG
jgi:hypothetical protein